jgi:hypothetical protein
MSIALTVKHLLACGASHEAVVKAVEEIEASMEETHARCQEASREYERERKRNYRMSRGQAACPGDNGDTSPLSPPMIYNSTPSIPSQNISIKPNEDPLFEGFWLVYPRKVGKGAARKAYRHALKRASHAEIVAGAKAYAASKPDPKFTPHATTWLNADRWLDEPERKPGANVVGFRKEFKPEPEGPKISEEERQANLAKLATIKFGTKKL